MKTGRFRSFGFMLAAIIGGGVVGWILFPVFVAFGVGLGAAINGNPEPMTLAIGYYRVHSATHTQAIIGAILGSLTTMRAASSKKLGQDKKHHRDEGN